MNTEHEPASQRNIPLKGAFLGLVSACCGSFIFALIDESIVIINGTRLGIRANYEYYWNSVATLMIAGILISSIPAIIGGWVLGAMILRDHRNNTLSRQMSFIKGTVIAGLLGGIICAFVSLLFLLLILLTGHGSLITLPFRMLTATILSLVAGGLVGVICYNHLNNFTKIDSSR